MLFLYFNWIFYCFNQRNNKSREACGIKFLIKGRKNVFCCSKTAIIKLLKPQAAQLGIIFFYREHSNAVMCLLERPVQGHITEDRWRKKAQHLAGIKPTTSLLQGVPPTALLQQLPIKGEKFWKAGKNWQRLANERTCSFNTKEQLLDLTCWVLKVGCSNKHKQWRDISA